MTPEEIEKRFRYLENKIRVMEDIEELKQLHIRYVNCLTFANWDEIADCFAEDGVIDVGVPELGSVKGKSNIELYFKKVISTGHFGKEGNFTIHPLISVDGDKATSNWLISGDFPR